MATITITEKPQVVNVETNVANSWTSTIIFQNTNLTGYTATAYVDNGSTLTAITVTPVSLTPNATFTVSLTKAQMTALGVGKYYWYFDYTNAGGTDARRAFAGLFTVFKYV